MKVCFFGSYSNSDFNHHLKQILKKQEAEIIEYQVEINGITSLVKSYFKLIFKHRIKNYDVMIIPWRAIITLPLAKIISRKPIVFFPFVSIFQTLVEDRKLIKKH